MQGEGERDRRLDQALFLQVLIRLPVVDISFLVLEFLHRLLLKDLVFPFSFQLLSHWKVTVRNERRFR